MRGLWFGPLDPPLPPLPEGVIVRFRNNNKKKKEIETIFVYQEGFSILNARTIEILDLGALHRHTIEQAEFAGKRYLKGSEHEPSERIESGEMLRWTSNRPSKAGIYWYRIGNSRPELIRIQPPFLPGPRRGGKDPTSELHAKNPERPTHYTEWDSTGMWAGPIAPPE